MPMISSYGRFDHRTETAQYGTSSGGYPLGNVHLNHRPERLAVSPLLCRIQNESEAVAAPGISGAAVGAISGAAYWYFGHDRHFTGASGA